MPKKFVSRTNLCFKKNLVWKIFMHRRGASRFCRKFFVSRDRKDSWGPSMFQKISVAKHFMHKKEISLFSVENFSVSQCQKNSRGTLLSFNKILVSKVFMHRRRGASRFCRKIFVSQDRNEKLGKGALLFSRKFWYKNFFMDRRGVIKIFRQIFFCLTVPKNFAREPFSVSLISGFQKC